MDKAIGGSLAAVCADSGFHLGITSAGHLAYQAVPSFWMVSELFDDMVFYVLDYPSMEFFEKE